MTGGLPGPRRGGLLSSEVLPSERGTGFFLSLFQGRERPGGEGTLCGPDLATYVRKTFLVMNVSMKEETASWSKDGSFADRSPTVVVCCSGHRKLERMIFLCSVSTSLTGIFS